ncbi:MAG: hypothetical protein CVU69_04505 [Deltaproteobacteria bacterium HGW-Deltaproteobacteria-4]|nr:MAG: hypothetical protein CVU69_04505 [Deltaproteobacteria bacterium HGW-Deltaproteobacteria-4]
MKRIKGFAYLCVLAFLTVSLAGCGGDSSSPEAAKFLLISGVVEDGPIENARVSLRDKENKSLAESSTLTDSNGAFSMQVPVGMDLVGLSVVAVGGIDRDTGIDFNELEMRSPLGLFQGDMTAIVVTPLTTLLAELHDNQKFSLVAAEERLRDWLNLPADANLTARPTLHRDLQLHTLLLSKIAFEIKEAKKGINPFSAIRTEMLAVETLDAAISNTEVMRALGLKDNVQSRIKNLQALLAVATTVEEAVFIYKLTELKNVFAVTIEQMLIDSVSFDSQNSNYQANLQILAETTLQAAGSEVITWGGTIPQRVARYILFTYYLRTWESLTVDSDSFAANLTPLASDPWIAELARSRSLYSVVSPLLLTELPGNDNQHRIAYFYGSDLSPHFQAEQLIGQVFDDAINDAVLLKIVEGKANAGLIDETRAIIATQIIQSEPKANAYRALANALIKSNRPQEALEFLDFSRDLYRKIIGAKGTSSASATDVENLLATASSYRKAGDLLNAESLLGDIAVIAQALATDAIIYGKLISGIKNVADAYIAVGDFAAASPLVEAMDNYSALTPAYAPPTSPLLITYKLRIFNWSETAKRYADLGNGTKVVEVFYKIQELRKVEGSAEATYWGPVVSLVESLYRVGETAKALELANNIPSGSADQIKAFKLVATYEALQGNMETAFSIVDNRSYVPKDEDRVDLLTYFTSSRPYIGQVLINNGRFNEARQALEKAKSILDGMILSNNLTRITNGYVRLAELYTKMGSPADVVKAKDLLQSAQSVMADDPYVVTALADIALGYHNLEESAAALTLLDHAKSLADVDPAQYRANVTPGLGAKEYAAQLYEKLVKSYEAIGDNLGIRTTAFSFQEWAKMIHSAGTVDDKLAIKECVYLLRAALYLDRAGYHAEAVDVLNSAKELTVGRVENNITVYDIVILKDRLANCLSVISTYAVVHEYEKALELALSLEFTTERNQAIQTLAKAYIDRDDFPDTWVASIDSDGDGMPDFFNPLASAEEIAASGLIMDDDSDGDGIPDSEDFRPLFDDRL